jgi:hypothetical protein
MELDKLTAEIQRRDPADAPALLAAIAALLAKPRPMSSPISSEPHDLVDVNVAGKLLGVSPSWLHHRPNLPFRRKLGGKVKFSRKGIAEWSKHDHHAV